MYRYGRDQVEDDEPKHEDSCMDESDLDEFGEDESDIEIDECDVEDALAKAFEAIKAMIEGRE